MSRPETWMLRREPASLKSRSFTAFRMTTLAGVLAAAGMAGAQNLPIAIVPVEGVKLSGALNVADGKAVIGASGSITAGDRTAVVTLPHRGNLHICSTTTVSLTSDSSVPAVGDSGDAPGLMMGLERGAVEANFATGKNSDVILTPDLRILISGPGVAAVRVRLGEKGDTCVVNGGPEAPYVLVSNNFSGGAFRVQPGQRVMFEHGSLNEVVDNEPESCGCPADPASVTQANAFPEAQSAGLAPAAPAVTQTPAVAAELSREEAQPAAPVAAAESEKPAPATAPSPAVAPIPVAEKKPGVFTRIGRFFRKLFGG
jgi:hypothetical protein